MTECWLLSQCSSSSTSPSSEITWPQSNIWIRKEELKPEAKLLMYSLNIKIDLLRFLVRHGSILQLYPNIRKEPLALAFPSLHDIWKTRWWWSCLASKTFKCVSFITRKIIWACFFRQRYEIDMSIRNVVIFSFFIFKNGFVDCSKRHFWTRFCSKR